MSDSVTLQLTTVVGGKTWRLFGVEFDTADGKFSTYIYALSHEHAEMVCLELRESARVLGSLEGTVPL